MTFSITACCAETGMFGVAVSSSSPAVAARCAHARAGVGAVASQNVTDPMLGVQVLDLMEVGRTATENHSGPSRVRNGVSNRTVSCWARADIAFDSSSFERKSSEIVSTSPNESSVAALAKRVRPSWVAITIGLRA